MDIPQQIDNIIAKRQMHLSQIRDGIANLEKVQQVILKFEQFRKDTAKSNNLSKQENTDLYQKTNYVMTDEFRKQCAATIAELKGLERRFSRNHIHISFVGKAGQGKSLVMQRISGLDGKIIPSADGSDCTGARSIITNQDASEVVAQISFYNKAELVQIINTYLDKIFTNTTYQVSSLEEIKQLATLNLSAQLDYTEVEANSMFQHLNDYIQHIDEFEALLGQVINVPADKIEEYVAQYNSENIDQKYYKYLGVREADIHCCFPYKKCGKIVLVDTIGLGATSIGVEKDMLETVKNDSDAILYMFRPDSLRPKFSKQDYQIIEQISRAVSPEYAKKMLFWVFNRVVSGKGENTKLIDDMMKEINQSIMDNKLPVAKALDVNCWEQAAVEQNLLEPVLLQMSEQLSEIDKLLLERMNRQMEQLYGAYQKIANQLQKVFSGTISQDAKRHFEGRIHSTYSAWTNQLRDLSGRKYELCNKPCEELRAALEEKQRNIFKVIPSLDDIIRQLNLGDVSPSRVYEKLTNHLRIEIIDDFLTLDIPLHELVRSMKTEIVHILADEDKGKLGTFVSAAVDDPDAWLDAFIATIQDDGQYKEITNALQALRDFNLSVKGQLIYLVRKNLVSIDPNLTNQNPIEGLGSLDKRISAQSILFWLNREMEDIYRKIHKECDRFLDIPNAALFAAIRDFFDRVVFSGNNVDDESISVREKWRYLYEDHLADIWKVAYTQYLVSQGYSKTWNELINEIKGLNQKKIFTISQ